MKLTITWEEPVAQGTEVVAYGVECQRVMSQSLSRELVTVPLTPAYDVGVEETQAQVTQGLGMNHLTLLYTIGMIMYDHVCHLALTFCFIAAETPYAVTARRNCDCSLDPKSGHHFRPATRS